MFDTLHEECGVFGIFSKKTIDVAHSTYLALYSLQHRGQENCGICVNDLGVISSHKDVGLVPDVFNKPEIFAKLGTGQIAIGHVRYSTTGKPSRSNSQPLNLKHVKGPMALAHNGSLTNAATLREKYELNGAIFHTTNDTEVLAYAITEKRLTSHSIEESIEKAMYDLQGAYSIVVMSATKLIAARDPIGFRPLCMGELDGNIIFSSESCAIDNLGGKFIRDVKPGEIIIVSKSGIKSIETHCNKNKNGKKGSICVFEYIYFARPDSIIEGVSVHESRKKAGAYLAISNPVKADVVIGVPDSGLDAALGYSIESGIPYGVGFIKNRYIGRTFIQPTQGERENAVRIKLNALKSTVNGKRVILVDDSIVRGTTSARIVSILREAGAKEVHMRVCSPPFMFPCYFGTDVDSKKSLIACQMPLDEIAGTIGVDSLGYLSKDDVLKLADASGFDFCDGCFTGEYPVPVPKEMPKNKFEEKLKVTD